MVWFQCEDCGENLKKPKLPNHFRQCYASKLSCIDCGQVFGRNDVEGHTQCITEMEKYGPKGVGKVVSNSNGKGSKPKPDIDLHVGLSQRPPWSCSLCNTTVTSQQTLFAHAEGKKHIAKAKGYHAKLQPQKTEVTLLNANDGTDAKNETPESVGKQKEEKPSAVATNQEENGTPPSSKKRKASGVEMATELGNDEVVEDKQHSKKKVKENVSDAKAVDSDSEKEDKKEKIKWKKLIKSSLKSNSDGSLKLKKLIKLVLKSLKESKNTIDERKVPDILEQKVRASSKFVIDGKYVRLAV